MSFRGVRPDAPAPTVEEAIRFDYNDDDVCMHLVSPGMDCTIRDVIMQSLALPSNKDDKEEGERRVPWKTLLRLPKESEPFLNALRGDDAKNRTAHDLSTLRQTRIEYARNRRNLNRTQSAFRSKQRTGFALILHEQQKSYDELEDALKKTLQARKKVLVAFYGERRAADVLSKIVDDDGVLSSEAYSTIEASKDDIQGGDTKRRDFTACPDGFDSTEWLELPQASRRVFLRQLPSVLRRHRRARNNFSTPQEIPDSATKNTITDIEDIEEDILNADLYRDLEMLEREKDSSSAANENTHEKNFETRNVATIVRTCVGNNPSSYEVEYLHNKVREVCDVSELTATTLMTSNQYESAKPLVVKRIIPGSTVKSETVRGLKSVFGKDSDSASNRDDTFIIVKSDNELSTILHVECDDVVDGVPKNVPITVGIVEELRSRKLITNENYRELKRRLDPALNVVSEKQSGLTLHATVKVNRVRFNANTDEDANVESVNKQLVTIRDEIVQMNTSIDRIDDKFEELAVNDDDDNRWCWQRWWTPTSALVQDSYISTKTDVDNDDDPSASDRPLCCFCWGSADHGKLGPDSRESAGQHFERAEVRLSSFQRGEIDRPMAYAVRQIVCSNFQTAVLLHDGVVYVTRKSSFSSEGGISSNTENASTSNTSSSSSSNVSGQMSTFVQMKFVKGTMPVQFLCAGSDHFLALTDDATSNIFAWGKNDCGQLGIGSRNDAYNPKRVLFPDLHYRERVTFAACGHKFSFCVTVTNRVFSWGSNEKGQLAHWAKTSDEPSFDGGKTSSDSIVTTPTICKAWEEYRNKNLPYNDKFHMSDRHCPIKDGWKTYHRLMIACGHDHAFSWQTTDEQLKRAHGVTDEGLDDARDLEFQKYEALCPRSQIYTRDMESLMDKLQTVLSRYDLMKVRYEKVKAKSRRLRHHALEHYDGGSHTKMNGGVASGAVQEALVRSEKYLQTKQMLAEAREKRRDAKKKVKIFNRELKHSRQSLGIAENELRIQSDNLNTLSSRIAIDRRKIDNIDREINSTKQKSNEAVSLGGKALAQIDRRVDELIKKKDIIMRELDVNIELHKFGKSSLNTKKISELKASVEEIENRMRTESEKMRVYSREASRLQESLRTIINSAKASAIEMSAKGNATDSKMMSSPSKSSAANHLESIVETAKRLRVRLESSSLQSVSRREGADVDPVKLAQSLLDHTEDAIKRELRVDERDLMGDIKNIFREILLQSCRLRRQVNGFSSASAAKHSSSTVHVGEEGRRNKRQADYLFESDSGSDEYI